VEPQINIVPPLPGAEGKRRPSAQTHVQAVHRASEVCLIGANRVIPRSEPAKFIGSVRSRFLQHGRVCGARRRSKRDIYPRKRLAGVRVNDAAGYLSGRLRNLWTFRLAHRIGKDEKQEENRDSHISYFNRQQGPPPLHLQPKLVARLLFKVRGSSGVQIGVFASAGRRTRSRRNSQRRSRSSSLAPAYSAILDHFQSSGVFTNARFTGLKRRYSTFAGPPSQK